MAKLIELETNQGSILIESGVSEQTGEVVQASAAEKVSQKLSELLKVLNPLTSAILKSVEDLGNDRPKEITAEFGLSVTAEGNIFVVRAAGEASLKIKFSWSKQ
jgi:hypothetical protein